MAESELLKILCIHGYRQNSKAFRERTGAFRKITKKYTELVFIDAPNPVPPVEGTGDQNGGAVQCDDPRGWWFSREVNYYHAQDYTDYCAGYEQSLSAVEQAFEQKGPFDGVLGFSQGACLVSLLCALQQQNKVETPFQFRFAIFVAGFKSRQSTHLPLYKDVVEIPTLHVYGETDRVIQKEMSEDLVQCYRKPRLLCHSGGHFIPTSSVHKKVYTEFLEDMLKEKKFGGKT